MLRRSVARETLDEDVPVVYARRGGHEVWVFNASHCTHELFEACRRLLVQLSADAGLVARTPTARPAGTAPAAESPGADPA